MTFTHVYKCTCTYAHTDGHAAHTRTHIPLATFVLHATLRHTMHTHTQCTYIGHTFTTRLSDGHGVACLE